METEYTQSSDFAVAVKDGDYTWIQVNVGNKDDLTKPQIHHCVQFHGRKISICVFLTDASQTTFRRYTLKSKIG